MIPPSFILMLLGKKKDENGKTVNFDKIYKNFIKPAIERGGVRIYPYK